MDCNKKFSVTERIGNVIRINFANRYNARNQWPLMSEDLKWQ